MNKVIAGTHKEYRVGHFKADKGMDIYLGFGSDVWMNKSSVASYEVVDQSSKTNKKVGSTLGRGVGGAVIGGVLTGGVGAIVGGVVGGMTGKSKTTHDILVVVRFNDGSEDMIQFDGNRYQQFLQAMMVEEKVEEVKSPKWKQGEGKSAWQIVEEDKIRQAKKDERNKKIRGWVHKLTGTK